MICPECGSSLGGDVISCSACGSLNRQYDPQQHIECENHAGLAAVAMCLVCGKPVCGDCTVKKGAKFFCDNAQHAELYGDWQVIYSCDSEFEADMIVKNLLAAQIESQHFSLFNHISTFWLAKKEVVHVWVRKGRAGDAAKLLHSLGLLKETGEQSS